MDIEIPYNVEERKDTGLYNSKLGIWFVFSFRNHVVWSIIFNIYHFKNR